MWPGMMRQRTAARYLELSVADFEREVFEGRLPKPVILGKHEHWNRARLDEALEKIAGGGVTSWRAELGLPEPRRDAA